MKKDHSHHSHSLSINYKVSINSIPNYILINSQGKKFICQIDSEDYELICRYKWNLHNQGYAVATIDGKTILMHRLIMGVTDPYIQIDHIHHNKLDNRKKNLRLCTPSENRRNSRKLALASSKFKGIYKEYGLWHVQIMQYSKVKNLGRYLSEITAAKVYDQKAREIFKEYSFLNFPDYVAPKQLVIPGFL